MQQRVKDGPRFGLLTQLLDLQRLQFAQRATDLIGRVPQGPDLVRVRPQSNSSVMVCDQRAMNQTIT